MVTNGRNLPSASRGGTFAGIFIGLVIGLVAAFAVTWYINKMPVPFREDATRTTDGDKSRPLAPASGTAGALQEPIALPGKPGDKPVDKPRFDFYRILPGGEDAPSPPTSDTRPAAPAAVPPPQLFLQVGAFQDAADADNLKARLALMGIEASVQQIILPDRGTLHRVRIGPFARLEDMNKVRGTLSQSGIEAGVAKAGN